MDAIHPSNLFHPEICFLAAVGLFSAFFPETVCKLLFFTFMGFAGLLLSVLLFSFTVEIIVGCFHSETETLLDYDVYEIDMLD
jgi:hypothetical protein